MRRLLRRWRVRRRMIRAMGRADYRELVRNARAMEDVYR